MCINRMSVTLLAIGFLAATGCKRSESQPKKESVEGTTKQAPITKKLQPGQNAILRVHWLGKKHVSANTNSAGLMEIWKLPESQRLEEQTVERLAVAPARWLNGASVNLTNQTEITNSVGFSLLKPLCADLVLEESYWEVWQLTNAQRQAALALRLKEERAAFWSRY